MNPLAAILTLLSASFVSADVYCGDSALKLTAYNPGTKAIFPVSSVLVSGEKEAILVNAQFGKSQAQEVVDIVRASGKKLTTIYVSHGDPDYYFGLDTIHTAFPDASIMATQPVVQHIKDTITTKLSTWNPILGTDAPNKTIIPSILTAKELKLEGHSLQIKGPADRSYVWIPSAKAVVDGVLMVNNIHAFMADSQTPESHVEWINALKEIQSLKPKVIVPGHALPGAVADIDSPAFTIKYIRDFDTETPKAINSTALIAAMKGLYPNAGSETSLEISAKVAKGEMKW
ncbi:beta-lactamase [Thraustotheca clavata]|uniref:Beta-lactamase n=1 Tax=Thraustotheca clavata TaxID=74557 RepID=A0A0A7CMG5_9STRA|nr:secreted protein [Thraustotheca clavata]OQR92295.1 beta-lactamase [Thraustotheca clavata]